MSERHPVTLADVAREAGVAKSTASYAFSDPGRLSPSTTQRVLDAATKLGYSGPSALGRALAMGRTQVVAIVTRALIEDPDTDPFALQVIDGLSRELAALGFGVLLLPPVTGEGTVKLHATALYDAAVTIRRIDGIEQTDTILNQRGVPWVRLDGVPNEHKAVVADATTPLIGIIEKLGRWGHERIGVVSLRHSLEPSPHYVLAGDAAAKLMSELEWSVPQQIPRDRLKAFVRSGVAPSHIAVCSIVTREEGYEAGKALLSLPVGERPTAIMCQADVFAWGVVDAARDLGLSVPGDVSVTGFDGIKGGVFDSLQLTTVMQDGVAKGRLVAKWVTDAIEEDAEPAPFPLPLLVRWGQTTGPAPLS